MGMYYKALDYLSRKLKKAKVSLGRAERKLNVAPEEIMNLTEKVELLDYIIDVVTQKGRADNG